MIYGIIEQLSAINLTWVQIYYWIRIDEPWHTLNTRTPTHTYYTCVLYLKQNNILTHTRLNRFIFYFYCYQIAPVEKSFSNHNKIILHALTLNNL